jgi:hypothetical protein
MTLLVSGNKIYIRNSAGVEKFNSSDKLAYRKYRKTSSISFPGGEGQFSHGWYLDVAADYYPSTTERDFKYKGSDRTESFQALGANDFLTMSFKISSCSSPLGSLLIGPTVMSAGPLLIHYGTATLTNYSWWLQQELLHWRVVDSNLLFYQMRYGHIEGGGTYNPPYAGYTSSLSLQYTATIYSYL